MNIILVHGLKEQEIYDTGEKDEYNEIIKTGIYENFDVIIPITTDHYLFLSGTPFRALESGEFIEENKFSIGLIQMNKKQSWNGKTARTTYLSMQEWLC